MYSRYVLLPTFQDTAGPNWTSVHWDLNVYTCISSNQVQYIVTQSINTVQVHTSPVAHQSNRSLGLVFTQVKTRSIHSTATCSAQTNSDVFRCITLMLLPLGYRCGRARAKKRLSKHGCKEKNPHPFGKRTVVQLAGRYLKRIGYPSNGFNGATHT